MANKNILIVEDDHDWETTIKNTIDNVIETTKLSNKYNIFTVSSFEEGKSTIKSNTFSIVTMDINLSAKDDPEGLELLNLLSKSSPDALKVIISGAENFNYVQEGYEKYGILRYLQKKKLFARDEDELENTMRSLLLYDDAKHLYKMKNWGKAKIQYEQAIQLSPETGLRFENIGKFADEIRTHPLSGLPLNDTTNDQIKKLLTVTNNNWAILFIKLKNVSEYYDAYGSFQGDQAIKTIGHYITSIYWENEDYAIDFISHSSGDHLITMIFRNSKSANQVGKRLLKHFNNLLLVNEEDKLYDSNYKMFTETSDLLYSFVERENGFKESPNGEIALPIITIEAFIVTSMDGPFSDIAMVTDPYYAKKITL